MDGTSFPLSCAVYVRLISVRVAGSCMKTEAGGHKNRICGEMAKVKIDSGDGIWFYVNKCSMLRR